MTKPQKIQVVGAAIGRPLVEIRSDVKKNASAKEIIAIATGRATAITMTSALKPNCFPAAAGGRAMLAPTGGGFLTTLSFRQW